MKTVPVMTVRRHLGEMLNEVRLKHEMVIIERAGKPMAKLCPLQDEAVQAAAVDVRLRAIDQLAAMGGRTKRGRAADQWLNRERSAWDRPK